MIGAGVGITPFRALLEDLPPSVKISVVIRASTPDDIVHRDEVAALVDHRGGQFHEVIGARHRVRFDARTLKRLVPDISNCDVYVCGPEGFSKDVVTAAPRARCASRPDPRRSVRVLARMTRIQTCTVR